MRTPILIKQRSFQIGRQVCVAALIALFIFAPHPLATSMAQSEDPKDKKPAPTPPSTIHEGTSSLRPKITYREKAKYTEEARDNGIPMLPDEKRRRAEALYNKAATLGAELP